MSSHWPSSFEGVPDPAELRVDVADHAVVLGPHPPERALVARRRGLGRRAAPPRGRGGESAPGDRHVDLVGVEGRRPAAGGRVGRVRPQVAQVGEPGTVLALRASQGSGRQEGRDADLVGSLGLGRERVAPSRRHVVAEVVQPLEPAGVVRPSGRARQRSRAARLRSWKVAGRPVSAPCADRRPGRCSRRAWVRTRPAERPGRGCRAGRRAGCRWRRPGCSSGRCPCTGTPVPVSMARPGCSGGRDARPRRPAGPGSGCGRRRWPAADRQSPRNWSSVTRSRFTRPPSASLAHFNKQQEPERTTPGQHGRSQGQRGPEPAACVGPRSRCAASSRWAALPGSQVSSA